MIGILGKKIGMTQVFNDKGVLVPVTAIDVAQWYVTSIKTLQRDGYSAVQVGLLSKKYRKSDFSMEWLKKPNNFFVHIKEIPLGNNEMSFELGQLIDFSVVMQAGESVDAFGTSKGRGFQGVVKRHGFSGGPASHGPRLGRKPGSIGSHRSQGHVAKGKKLPGHMGVDRRCILNLEIVRVEAERNVVFVKGSMPGYAGALVFLRKSPRYL